MDKLDFILLETVAIRSDFYEQICTYIAAYKINLVIATLKININQILVSIIAIKEKKN